MRLLVAGVVAAIGARTAAADCMMIETKLTPIQRQVIYLGTYQDLLGHPASFYFDVKTSFVIGPVDHDGWPTAVKPLRKFPTTIPLGTAGTLSMQSMIEPKGVAAPRDGWFEGFGKTTAKPDLPATIAKVKDPFVLGLLAPANPAAEAKVQAITKNPAQRDDAVDAAQGMLYAATGPRAQALLGGIAYRDLASASLDLVATLRDGGLAGLAARTPGKSKTDWTDYLPELAAAWAAKRDPAQIVDDLLVGQLTPTFPVDVDETMTMRHHCGLERDQMRGPFEGRRELGTDTVRALVRTADPLFAKKVETAFVDVATAPDHFVVAVRDKTVLLAGVGGDSVIAVELGKPIGIGAKVRVVAHGPRNITFFVPHLTLDSSAIMRLGKATRVIAAPRDVPGMIATLERLATSTNLAVHAGTALALLFELAGQVPGWSIDDARAFAWTLPGNVYATPEQWLQIWSEILGTAIRMAPDTKVADEVERGLPAILSRFGALPGGRITQVPGAVARQLAVLVAGDIIARRLLAKDLPGAARMVALATGPIGKIAGATQVAKEGPRHPNSEALMRGLSALVTKLQGGKVVAPSEGQRSTTRNLVEQNLRPYAELATWRAALASAGY